MKKEEAPHSYPQLRGYGKKSGGHASRENDAAHGAHEYPTDTVRTRRATDAAQGTQEGHTVSVDRQSGGHASRASDAHCAHGGPADSVCEQSGGMCQRNGCSPMALAGVPLPPKFLGYAWTVALSCWTPTIP